jgi:MFS family permease
VVSRRWMIPLCMASLLWAFSFGLGAPLASLLLRDAGHGPEVIGHNTSIYYLGIALASLMVPLAVRRWGYGAMVLGMIFSGLSVIAFPWSDSLSGWFVLRAVNGVAGALSLIPLETYVNHGSSEAKRAQNFGYYAFCIALGIALGQGVGLSLYGTAPFLAFHLGGTAALAAAAIVLAWRPQFPAPEPSSRRAPLYFRRNFLSYGSAWCQGFLEGAMVGFLAIYLLDSGLSDQTTGYLMSGTMIGVILAQVPVAFLADRYGRTPVLLGCYAVALAGLICLLPSCGIAWLAIALFAVGACSGAFYPLGLAILGERTTPAGLARANSWFLAINCVGSMIGPDVVGRAIHRFGNDALISCGLGAVLAVLLVWALLALCRPRNAARALEAAGDLRSAA